MSISVTKENVTNKQKTVLKIVDSCYESMRYIKISSNIKIFILIMRFCSSWYKRV